MCVLTFSLQVDKEIVSGIFNSQKKTFFLSFGPWAGMPGQLSLPFRKASQLIIPLHRYLLTTTVIWT